MIACFIISLLVYLSFLLTYSHSTGNIFCLYQVLKGGNLNIKMFGYSIAGNMDLDNNQYPDVAIGSLSDTVVVYR